MSSADDCARRVLDVVPLVVRAIRATMRRHRGALSPCPSSARWGTSRRVRRGSVGRRQARGPDTAVHVKIIDGLVERRLVCRGISTRDRRQITLSLSARGQATLRRARARTQARVAEMLGILSEGEPGLGNPRHAGAPSRLRAPAPARSRRLGATRTRPGRTAEPGGAAVGLSSYRLAHGFPLRRSLEPPPRAESARASDRVNDEGLRHPPRHRLQAGAGRSTGNPWDGARAARSQLIRDAGGCAVAGSDGIITGVGGSQSGSDRSRWRPFDCGPQGLWVKLSAFWPRPAGG